MLRLGANESPHGPFPAARAAVTEQLDGLHRYPSPGDALVDRLAAIHGVPAERIVLGNGGDAIIGYLSIALLSPGDEVVLGWPSFPTYVIDAVKERATPVRVPVRPDGAMDLDAMLAAITPATRLVWVCTPNNPTGASVGRAELAAFLDAVPQEVVVVIDEAYYEFAAGPDHVDAIAEHLRSRPNVGVLRTFSKLYGLAALRIGWFAGPPALAQRLREVRHYYDVIDVAIAAALASLDDDAEVERRRAENRAMRERLADGLRALGLTCLPSDANFVCAVVDDAPAIAGRLAGAGILVRSLEDLDRPDLLRVTVGSADDVDRFLTALPAALGPAVAPADPDAPAALPADPAAAPAR
jgi:histidinol-phosphate aminotransferase